MRATGESNPKANARFIHVARYRRGLRADWDYALSGSLYHIAPVSPAVSSQTGGGIKVAGFGFLVGLQELLCDYLILQIVFRLVSRPFEG